MKVAHYLAMISLLLLWQWALRHFTPGKARKALSYGRKQPGLGLDPGLTFYLLSDLGQVI